jgi:GNAT superfamily N-acetyltransferase
LARRDDGYEISTDPHRLDLDLVHQWLSTDAYWALGRSRDTVVRAVAGSLNYGLFRADGGQVGFARAVTDHATFAWICDVYIDRAARGRGLGSWLVGVVRDDLWARGIRRLLLATADAHGVYAKVGFTPLADPDRWMEIDARTGVRPVTRKEQNGSNPLTVDP